VRPLHRRAGWRSRQAPPSRARRTVPSAFRASTGPGRIPGAPPTAAPSGSGGKTCAALPAAPCQDRSAGTGPHADAEAVCLRAVAVVRLVGALPLGHLASFSIRRPADGRPVGEYTGGHRRRTKGLTTESASRPRRCRAVWKTPVL
jgi:hypothetical protein